MTFGTSVIVSGLLSSAFTGKNILPEIPEELARAVEYLTEKEREGVFVFGSSFSDWSDVDELIRVPLGLGHRAHIVAHAIGLAYLATDANGAISFPESENVWPWAAALFYISPYCSWSPEVMARVVRAFPSADDGMSGQIGASVRVFCRTDYDRGLQLLELLSEHESSARAGLMECDFDRYCSMFPASRNREMFVSAYVNTAQLTSDAVNKAYLISKSFDSFFSRDALNFLLKSVGRLDDEALRSDCETRILALLDRDTTDYVRVFCIWVTGQDGLSSFCEKCILALIKGLGDASRTSSLQTIDNTLAFYEDNSDFLGKVILCVAENLQPADVLCLRNILRNLSEKEGIFQDLVLFFVLNPKGRYRHVGRRLWDEFHLEKSSIDISALPENAQCLFIVFMLRDFGNPETRLPKLMPLFNSESDRVVNTLIAELRPYTDDYMGHVTSAIDSSGVDTDATRAIKKYVDDRHQFIEKRRNLKELSPKYAQYELYREAMKSQQAHVKKYMDEAEQKRPHNNIYDLFKKQVLARGGGWRKKDGTTQHLSPIQVSLPARMMDYAMMPIDRIKWYDELMKDYGNVEAGDS